MFSEERNQLYSMSGRTSRSYVRQSAGPALVFKKFEEEKPSFSLVKKFEEEKPSFSLVKKSVLWIGILILISIAAVIGLATILYPAYAIGLALAPSVSSTTKVLVIVGIPLFWFSIKVISLFHERK